MLNIAHYSVKSEEIRAAALCELAEAALNDETIDGLDELARSVLTSDTFDKIVPLLAGSRHVQLNLLLGPLNIEMPAVHRRLWLDSIYEFYCAHNTSLPILLAFFPELTRRKHEKYMRRNTRLMYSKSMYLTPEEEAEIHASFKELLDKYDESDIREIYMMLQERFNDIAMTTLVKHTLNCASGSEKRLAVLKSKSIS